MKAENTRHWPGRTPRQRNAVTSLLKRNETSSQFSELAGSWIWGSGDRGCWASADGGSTFSVGTWSRLLPRPLLAAPQPGPTQALRSLGLQVLPPITCPPPSHPCTLCVFSSSPRTPAQSSCLILFSPPWDHPASLRSLPPLPFLLPRALLP